MTLKPNHRQDGRELTDEELEKIELFKVQLPLNGPGPALFYNRDRTIYEQFEIDEKVLSFFKHGHVKRFMWGLVETQNRRNTLELFNEPYLGPDAEDW